jgi:hypothetical protein
MPEPWFALGAAPAAQVIVPSLTRREGVRDLLERPPHARHAGWNLTTLEHAELRTGPTRLHIQNGERKHLDLHEDGTFTAVVTIDRFLGHGRWNFRERPLINGLALIEFTHEFVSFYGRLLGQHIEPRPESVRFSVGLHNAHFERDGQPRALMLAPGEVGNHYGYFGNVSEAPRIGFKETVDTQVSDDEPHIDVSRVAFSLVRHAYVFFRFTDDDVPYTTPETDAIDFEQITEGHGG